MDHFKQLLLWTGRYRVEELGKILPSVFRKHVSGSRPAVMGILAPLWAQIAGKQLAEHCRPVAFEAGTLILATACPSWAAQLRQMTEEIRARVNSYLGTPITRRIRVREVMRLDLFNASVQSRPGADCIEVAELLIPPPTEGVDSDFGRDVWRSSRK